MDAIKLTETQLENILIKAYCLFMENEYNSTISAGIRLTHWISGYMNVDYLTATNIMITVLESCKEVLK